MPASLLAHIVHAVRLLQSTQVVRGSMQQIQQGHYHTATKKTTTWLPGPHCLPLDYPSKKMVPNDYQRIEIVPHHYLSVETILLAYQSVPVLPLRYQTVHSICNSEKLLAAQIVPNEIR